MKLFSHGPQSDLLGHCREVAGWADGLPERVVFVCHDAGKATRDWQAYIVADHAVSPHHHAAAGGILAALLLRELGETPETVLAALHSAGAHHSTMKQLSPDQLQKLCSIADDTQAKTFFLDRCEGLAALLPDCPEAALPHAWAQFQQMAHALAAARSEPLEEFKNFLFTLDGVSRLRAYLRGREMLGKLCLADQASAARQSGHLQSPMPAPETATAHRPFLERRHRVWTNSGGQLANLRTALREALLQTVETDRVFTLVDAPTGMGKTEAMLCAAERIRQRIGGETIIFAVPQLSLADQIFDDYLADSASAQIWNSRRHATASPGVGNAPPADDANDDPESGSDSDRLALLLEAHPFAHSYNVTTFNQVLLSMLHPNRTRCPGALQLRNAVIVMDEFHKLPGLILPWFFPAAREFAQRSGCRFLLGSATPFQRFEYFDLADAQRIPEAATEPLYQAPELNDRRRYHKLGTQTGAELENSIAAYQDAHPQDNLLVVVNLVAQGSWPLRRDRLGGYRPWEDWARLQTETPERAVVFLDGLTPPVLRKPIIQRCRELMRTRRRPVTLYSTQMIEVGVDLDFDAAFCDFQDLASVIQRGGRVGREGGRRTPCPVMVFALELDNGKNSATVLADAETQGTRGHLDAFQDIQNKVRSFRRREAQWFRMWSADEVLSDRNLTAKLAEIQEHIYARLPGGVHWEQLFKLDRIALNSLGATFEMAHYLAEIVLDDYAEAALVVPDGAVRNELSELDRAISEKRSTPEQRHRYRSLLSDYTIRFRRGLDLELGLTDPVAVVENPDRMAIYQNHANQW